MDNHKDKRTVRQGPMKTLTVACIQQKMRLPQTLEEYREDLRRFLRGAVNKRAQLVVFPELAGVMVIPPLLGGFQASLLKRADLARRRQSSLLQKVNGGVSAALAGWMNANFRQMAGALLTTQPQMVWDAYEEVFGGLAQEFDVTLVAPSCYLPDPLDGVLRNLAVVYGPGGEQLGFQAKRVLHPEDEDLAQPGFEWNVIPTPVGQIGLMLGGDLLYPEVGRLLAYQGAEMLIAQGAATERALYEKLRSGALARMQDNQLFAAISFLVGHNEFSLRQRDPFAGRSSILAPQELTPRSSGILVETSNIRSESVLTAVWDFPALADLWETSDTPTRSRLPMEVVGPALAQLYRKMRQMPKGSDALLSAPVDQEPETGLRPEHAEEKKTLTTAVKPTLSLDDLPVLASVESFLPSSTPLKGANLWPIVEPDSDEAEEEEDEASESTDLQAVVEIASGEDPEEQPGAEREGSAKSIAGLANASRKEGGESEEETQEMDALFEPKPGDST